MLAVALPRLCWVRGQGFVWSPSTHTLTDETAVTWPLAALSGPRPPMRTPTRHAVSPR
jgi:hypothetical protein